MGLVVAAVQVEARFRLGLGLQSPFDVVKAPGFMNGNSRANRALP